MTALQRSPDDNDSGNGNVHTERPEAYEMDDSVILDEPTLEAHPPKKQFATNGLARHTLGLILLLCVVFLWTCSNFLGSSIFADDSYAKPFFLTYLNTSAFAICIVPPLVQTTRRKHRKGTLGSSLRSALASQTLANFWRGNNKDDTSADEEETFLKPSSVSSKSPDRDGTHGTLDLTSTARFSLVFCLLWFAANYFAMACLQYTTVASTTILTSTSSVWTLLIGALTRTEKFTWRKLCGVLASLAGIVLISQVDLKAGAADSEPASSILARQINEFPTKTPYELAFGDALALLSAVIYGFYTIALKRVSMSALPKSIHMPTFFGFVGVFNMLFLLPMFPILHYSGIEVFQLPPSRHIWTILLINSMTSLFSDICWAYAMVFTSPLVVTVGLSLTIPLSLVGEMIIQGRFESWVYWVGAMVVVGSFVFVEREEKEEIDEDEGGDVDVGEPGPAIIVEDWDEVLGASERSEVRRDEGEVNLLQESEATHDAPR